MTLLRLNVMAGARGAARLAYAGFAAWYLWCLSLQPQPMLWWASFNPALLLVSCASLWPGSVQAWLPASIMALNNMSGLLPWPGVKAAYLGPAIVCCAALFRRKGELAPARHGNLRLPYVAFFICLMMAAVFGIFSHFVPVERAAIYELLKRLKSVPFIDEMDGYVPLRHMWVWSLALCMCAVLRRYFRSLQEVARLLWNVQVTAGIIALAGCSMYIVPGPRIRLTFTSPAVMADVFTACLILGFCMMRLCVNRWQRVILAVVLVLEWWAIMLSGCRTNFIVLLVFGMAWGWRRIRSAFRISRPIMAGATAILVAVVVIAAPYAWGRAPVPARTMVMRVPTVKRLAQIGQYSLHEWRQMLSYAFTGRIDHWQTALRMTGSLPLWGVGCGLFEQNYSSFKTADDAFQYARVHNLYLRILTEGGFVTFTAFAVLLGALGMRLRRYVSVQARQAAPDAVALAWPMVYALIGIACTSLTSDIWYETTETVMFLSMLAASLAFVCDRIAAAINPQVALAAPSPAPPKRKRASAHQRAQARLKWLNVPWVVTVECLLLLGIAGIWTTRRHVGKSIQEGSLLFGFSANPPIAASGGRWMSMGRYASVVTTLRHPVFSFGYQPLNVRAAREGETLRVLVNGTPTASLLLTAAYETVCYCDVSELSGSVARIEFEASRVFVPLDERWFEDARAYGALITKLTWHDDIPTSLVGRVTGMWNTRWSACPAGYSSLGYPITNRTFRVDPRKPPKR